MYLALADTAATTTQFSVPTWSLWGLAVAFGLTFGLLLIASLFAIAFTSATGGWLGGAEPWKEFKGTFMAFLFYGLPTGMVGSYVWSVSNPWIGILAGLAVFAVVWWVNSVIVGRKKRR